MGANIKKGKLVMEIQRMGMFTAIKIRPICIKFQGWDTKMEIYKHDNNLKGPNIHILRTTFQRR